MKSFMKEFRDFVMRGNVMDMAIGVIIGAAFGNIVTALTENIINPMINGIGGTEVGGMVKIYGGQYINYGAFITAVINFIIMAFVLFLLLKGVNKMLSAGKKKKDEGPAPKTDEAILLEEIRDLLKKEAKK